MSKICPTGIAANARLIAVAALAIGISSPTSSTGAERLTLLVVDNAGQAIGALVGVGRVAVTLKPALTQLVSLDVRVDGIGNRGNEYFATTDCSGATYLSNNGLIREAYLESTRPNAIIFADPNGTPTPVQSVRYATGMECATLSEPTDAYPIKSVSFAKQGFNPPFHIEAK